MVPKYLYYGVGEFTHQHHKRWIGAAIGAAASLLNMGLQSSVNEKNIENQNMLFRKQLDFQREMNANGALLQKQGLERAGLNVLSQFGPDMNLQAPTPSKSDYVAPQIDAGALASLVQQQPLVDAEVRKKDAETNLVNAQTNNTNIDSLLKQTQEWSIRQKTPEEVRNIQEQTNKFVAEISKIDVDKQYIEKSIEKLQSEISTLDLNLSYLLDSYDVRLQQLAMDVAVKYSQSKLNAAQTAVAYKSIQVMANQIRLINSQISLNQQQYQYLVEQTTNLCIDGNFKQFEFNIKQKFGENQAAIILDNLLQDNIEKIANNQWRPLMVVTGAFGNIGKGASAFVP